MSSRRSKSSLRERCGMNCDMENHWMAIMKDMQVGFQSADVSKVGIVESNGRCM